MENILTHCETMLAQCKAQGAAPIAFIMSPATKAAVCVQLDNRDQVKQSALSRMFHRPEPRTHLFEVPIIENRVMPDGAVSLQIAARLPVSPQSSPQGSQGAEVSPFVQRERVEAPAQESGDSDEVAPTLRDLASATGKMPSSTDVLIKAMEGVEDVPQVIVVRVHRDGRVDMCVNANMFEVSGILQKAQIFAAQQGWER